MLRIRYLYVPPQIAMAKDLNVQNVMRFLLLPNQMSKLVILLMCAINTLLLGLEVDMAIEMKEWSKETKKNIIISALVIIAAFIFFTAI